MAANCLTQDDLTFKPLTSNEWPDFEALFEEHGPQNGCWCCIGGPTRAECQRGFGEGNKQAFKAIVEAYPLRTEITKMLPYERYMGIQSTFERVGFEPVAQRSERRVIVRYHIR